MAVFNKNTLTQVSGFNNQIIAGELVYNQKTFWNVSLSNSDGTPLNLTGSTITSQILRRQLSNVRDSRYGLTFDIADYSPPPSPVNLTIANQNLAGGSFTLVIDESAWAVVSNDPELDINATNPVGFSGNIKIAIPASGSTPAQDMIIFLLFLIRSDGVTN
ncbi:hypothetical protein EBZ39_17335 [bacterium]|nr:hypothetical protein [bacterium]